LSKFGRILFHLTIFGRGLSLFKLASKDKKTPIEKSKVWFI